MDEATNVNNSQPAADTTTNDAPVTENTEAPVEATAPEATEAPAEAAAPAEGEATA